MVKIQFIIWEISKQISMKLTCDFSKKKDLYRNISGNYYIRLKHSPDFVRNAELFVFTTV